MIGADVNNFLDINVKGLQNICRFAPNSQPDAFSAFNHLSEQIDSREDGLFGVTSMPTGSYVSLRRRSELTTYCARSGSIQLVRPQKRMFSPRTSSRLGPQAESLLKHAGDPGMGAKIATHNRDMKFTKSFDQKLNIASFKVRKTANRSPNTNAYVKWFRQTLQQGALDHSIVFGQQHLDVIVEAQRSFSLGSQVCAQLD
ncbi:MAG: hypothetical protein R3C10_23350 [Pirellulales bacterium]